METVWNVVVLYVPTTSTPTHHVPGAHLEIAQFIKITFSLIVCAIHVVISARLIALTFVLTMSTCQVPHPVKNARAVNPSMEPTASVVLLLLVWHAVIVLTLCCHLIVSLASRKTVLLITASTALVVNALSARMGTKLTVLLYVKWLLVQLRTV